MDWDAWIAFAIFIGVAVGLGLVLRFGANRLIARYGRPERVGGRPGRTLSIIVGLGVWGVSVAVLVPVLQALDTTAFWAIFIALVPTWIVQSRIEDWSLRRRRPTPRSS